MAASPESLYNLGVTRQLAGDADGAIESYRHCLALNPALTEAYNNLGTVLEALGRLPEAVECFRQAVALKPDYVRPLINLGKVFRSQGLPIEAMDSLLKALELSPGNPRAFTNLGLVLADLGRLDEASACLQRAVAADPRLAEAHLGLGRALLGHGNYIEAAQRFERALQIDPNLADAHFFQGVVLLANAANASAAVERFDRALTLDPKHARAHAFRARALVILQQLPQAIASLEQALQSRPDDADALAQLLNCCAMICDWTRVAETMRRLRELPRGVEATQPFFLMATSDDPAEHLRAASWQASLSMLGRAPLPPFAAREHEKIRVAYVSWDFFTHATSFLMAELFELHDRSGFEVFGVALGPDDRSPLRERVVRGFDVFVEMAPRSDLEIATWLRENAIDIVVDLKGHTAFGRPGIFAHRPAPIQVSYLGYPGTMAAAYMDYLVADEFLIPPDAQQFYLEKIAYQPDTYQVNDRKRRIAATTPARADVGLPPEGFVFCCFNNNWKITAPVFDVWMRLLASVEGSVLWLLEDNAVATANLRKEAARRGISPQRLVFCNRLPNDEHLARQRLADLFLDTLPYNAHTTASDALWAGLPLVTCSGRSFAARVAGSLLRAVGLGELVTTSLAEYERLALQLATDPSALQVVRAALAQNRERLPLFDTPRFCRHLEAAYRWMWENYRKGRPPETFKVDRIEG